jgi:exo-poly-alpha-galacturonosidase
MSMASNVGIAIDVNGFKDPLHRLKNVSFPNITLPEQSKIMVNDAEKIKVTTVQSVTGTSLSI